ncbi:MAG: DUF5110 domain-containing protein [Bacteroidales bacterium]|nr:DUF5110 domain-containing protein [Bacteroidales bacterium]
MRFALLTLLLMVSSSSFSGPKDKYKLEQLPDGVVLYYEEYTLRVQICAPRIFHVICAPGSVIPEKKSLSVTREWSPVSWEMTKKRGDIILKTAEASLEIETSTILGKFYNSSGELILAEKERAFSPTTLGDTPTWNVFETFRLSADEGIYGLGQHQYGWMNHRGKEVVLVQTNTTAVNPFLVSSKGWGILWDNYSKTIFRDDRNGATFWSEYGDAVDYYLFIGNDVDDVIAGYRHATGQAPMFGKWAFGFWQSKERYINAKELSDVVAEYRMRRLPIDVIVQDWRYWGENNMWSSMQFDPQVYPEPEKTLERLHHLFHVHYVISIWPAIGRDTELFKELNDKSLTYSPVHWSSGYFYDAFDPEAREIYWRYIRDGLLSKGVDGLWMDATEPELADQHTFEESEFNIKRFGNTAAGPIDLFLNPYSLMTTEGIYRNWRNAYSDKRALILTRSAFTGQQRNAAITWSGDINASYDIMRRQISAGLNFTMAGIPYWTTDIGGFFLHGHDKGFGPGLYPGGPSDPAYKELYVRWFQFGAFCPIFRSHGTHAPREVWQFGDVGDWGYEAMAKILNLRYRLLPYIYSTAWNVTNDGYTMMRGLAMDFKEDKKVLKIDNEYLFGPSLLVCPVTNEQYFCRDTALNRSLESPASISLYLPENDSWFDFWTGEMLEGGQKITRETPVDLIPLYAKAGSIIPMGPLLQYVDEKPADPIELRIYPGANGSFTLYEDEGDNYNYEKGAFSTIEFNWNHEAGILSIGKRKGSFPGMLQARRFQVVIVTPGHGTGVEVTLHPDKIIQYAGEELIVKP